MKRILAFLLVLALALSLTAPVSATADTEPLSTQVLKMKNEEKGPTNSMVHVYPYAQTFSTTVLKGNTGILQFKLTNPTSAYGESLFYVVIFRGSVDEVEASPDPVVVEERLYEMSDFQNDSIAITWKADSRYPVGEYTLLCMLLDPDGTPKNQTPYAVDLYVVDRQIPATGMEVMEVRNAEYIELDHNIKVYETRCIAYALTPFANTSDRKLTVTSAHPQILNVYTDAGYIYFTGWGYGDTSITITCGNVTKTIPIYVGRAGFRFEAKGEKTELCVGMTDTIKVEYMASHVPYIATWETSNPDVVTVKDGVVTAVGPGVASIIVTCAGVTQRVKYTVTAHELPEGTPVTQRTATKPAMAVGPCSCCGNKEAVNIFEKPVFTDTDYKAWYSDHVDYVYDEGIMNGTGEHSFGPDMALSRAMVVTVLYRAAGSPEVTGEIPFADVEEGMWYSDAILWAYQNEVVNGVGDGSRFDPNGNITREQIATILYRYTQSLGVEMAEGADLNTYPDGAMVSAYAEEGMAWAVGEGLITGAVSNGVTTISPKNTATRAQFATIISRYQQMFPADSE